MSGADGGGLDPALLAALGIDPAALAAGLGLPDAADPKAGLKAGLRYRSFTLGSFPPGLRRVSWAGLIGVGTDKRGFVDGDALVALEQQICEHRPVLYRNFTRDVHCRAFLYPSFTSELFEGRNQRSSLERRVCLRDGDVVRVRGKLAASGGHNDVNFSPGCPANNKARHLTFRLHPKNVAESSPIATLIPNPNQRHLAEKNPSLLRNRRVVFPHTTSPQRDLRAPQGLHRHLLWCQLHPQHRHQRHRQQIRSPPFY